MTTSKHTCSENKYKSEIIIGMVKYKSWKIIDHLMGTEITIKFCPFCGANLKSVSVTEKT